MAGGKELLILGTHRVRVELVLAVGQVQLEVCVLRKQQQQQHKHSSSKVTTHSQVLGINLHASENIPPADQGCHGNPPEPAERRCRGGGEEERRSV